MEQTYNYTQDKPSYHTNGITNYATQIQSKASTLKNTAESKSTEELTNTRNNDIQGDTKHGEQLKRKAEQLKQKAGELYRVAESLRKEAAKSRNPLEPLETHAKNLKDAAKKDPDGGGNDGLYYHADALATLNAGLDGKATAVIEKFNEVAGAYDTLMNQAKGVTGLSSEQQQLVTAVDTTYTALKDIYDRILNLTKLANLAGELQQAATTNAPALQHAASDLATKVQNLRNGSDNDTNANAKVVKSQFESVQNAFYALEKAKQPKDEFDALKGVYTNIRSTTFPDLLIPNLNNNS